MEKTQNGIVTSQLVVSLVEGWLDDYYPNSSEGMMFGNSESIIYTISQSLDIDEKEIGKEIGKLIASGQIIEDSTEYINPENDQRTVYVDYIYTKNSEKEIEKEQSHNANMEEALDIIKKINPEDGADDDDIQALSELGFDYNQDSLHGHESIRDIIRNWWI